MLGKGIAGTRAAELCRDRKRRGQDYLRDESRGETLRRFKVA